MIAPFFLLFVEFGTSFSDQTPRIPAWFNVLMGLSYLTYRMLDEMDGKQARRTGNSSPLGMLFDHGCDAFTIGFMFMINAKLLYLGDSLFSWIFIAICSYTFHMGTIESYYMGGLYLGPGNGISDGSVIAIFLLIGLGFVSREFVTSELI